ncbi:MAG: three-Cys-motif partner protein TcmP [Roseibium sp.]
MNLPTELYIGREQTYIKHTFLRRYLETLAVKVLYGGWDAFNYVDGFAGPWEIRDEEGCSDASFGVAVDLLETVKEFVEMRRRGPRLKVRFYLCEKNPDAVARLRAYAQRRDDIEIHVFEGVFEDNLEQIARLIPDGFTFTFIDPTNWVVRIEDVCAFLKGRAGEFLFNFMTEEVSRHSVNPKVAHQFGDFVGDPNWEDTARRLPAGLKGEIKVLHLLKDAFRSHGVATYLPDFSILKPLANREKMRLMLGTNRPEGVKLFRDIHGAVEREEFKSRREAKAAKTNQDQLFSADDYALHEQGERGLGCKRYQVLSKHLIAEALRERRAVEFSSLALEVMERFPMKETHVKDLCVEMKARGLLDFELKPKAKKPRGSTVIMTVEK